MRKETPTSDAIIIDGINYGNIDVLLSKRANQLPQNTTRKRNGDFRRQAISTLCVITDLGFTIVYYGSYNCLPDKIFDSSGNIVWPPMPEKYKHVEGIRDIFKSPPPQGHNQATEGDEKRLTDISINPASMNGSFFGRLVVKKDDSLDKESVGCPNPFAGLFRKKLGMSSGSSA